VDLESASKGLWKTLDWGKSYNWESNSGVAGCGLPLNSAKGGYNILNYPYQNTKFIDGMRCLAALYIVLHHSLQTANYFPSWLKFFTFGHEIVVIFIVISGFCLALPIREDWNLNAKRFFRRRIRRILPPYYAAVALGLICVIVLTILTKTPQDYLGNPFTRSMLLSHLTLTQNWVHQDIYTLDGPLWSIAVECQIYLLFPIIVLLWRKTGRWPALAVVFLFSGALFKVTHGGGFANFLFLFAEGMLGAQLAMSHKRWILLLSPIYAIAIWLPLHYLLHEATVGMTTALLMAYLVWSPSGNRILGSKWLVWGGSFSYSMYLVHSFFQVLAYRLVARRHLNFLTEAPSHMAVFMVLVVSPIAIAGSYGFHLIFERPFMTRKLDSSVAVEDGVPAASLS